MISTRFSIRRLMLLVVVAAALSWLYRSVQGFAFVLILGYFATITLFSAAYGTSISLSRRVAFWTMVLTALVEFLILAYLGVFSLRFYSTVYKLMVLLVLLPVTIASGVRWAQVATSADSERRRAQWWAWSVVVFLAFLPVSMTVWHWPMWVAFHLSRPSLDRLADRLASGETLARPEWAGLFLVRKLAPVDVGPGNLAVVVGNDSTGHTWLVRMNAARDQPVLGPQYHQTGRIPGNNRWWHDEVD